MSNLKKLEFYLDADKFAMDRNGSPNFFGDEVWKFQIALRKCEFYRSTTGIHRLKYIYWKLRKRRLGFHLGFDIPEGVFGPGLRINHFGNIVINTSCIIGGWCDIHQGVNIGEGKLVRSELGNRSSPIIGDNVWIGPGAKIFGGIVIGSRVLVGANAVVGKSYPADVTIAGVPSKIIREIGTSEIDIAANPKKKELFFLKNPQHHEFYF